MFNTANSFWDNFSNRSLVGWGLPLQLQRRGNYFSDSLFHDTRSHFGSAVKDILREFSEFSKRDNDFASYQRFRDRQLTGTDRVGSIVEEADKFKIVIDVHGFIENDLKVTFLNDNELIVEGLLERKDEVSFAKQTFKRRFLLPSKVIVDQATSSLSSDNILTIVVPKLQQQSITANQEGVQLSLDKSEQKESTKMSFGNQQTTEKQEEQSSFVQQESSLNKQVQNESSLQNILGKDSTFQSALDKNFTELPITPRKDFFGDSYFDSVRNQFQNRVKEIMDRTLTRFNSEDLNIYKSLREKEDNENNVAITVSGDSKEHKIVMDVHGFSEGDLKVKAVSNNELLVEGKMEKKTDMSYCNNSFRRSFCLPDVANIQQTTSALSSDGVLTIIVPKTQQCLPIEYSIPITKTQETRTKSIRSQDITSTTQPKEHIVPIALGYKDDSSSTLEDEIQKQTIHTVQASSPSASLTQQQQSTLTQQQQSTGSPISQSRIIPISPAGSFYSNSIFEGAKKTVESAVQDAMTRSSLKTQENTQTQMAGPEMPCSINLKSIVSSSFDDGTNSFKINLDVFGYTEKDLKIKAIGENGISIEGYSETKDGGTLSKQSFQKSFQLPNNVLIHEATSALSSEGMLTITMPKKVQQSVTSAEHIIPVRLAGQESIQETKNIENFNRESSVSTQSSVVASEQITESNGKREYVVPVTLESTTASTQSGTSVDQTKTQMLQKHEDQSHFKSQFENDFFKDIPSRKFMNLPIATRGEFYQDSFFNDSRDVFESCLKRVMNRFRSFPSFSDDLGFYKSLRDHRMPSCGTPTEATSEDQQFHKIVVDVQGFTEKDLQIKALEGNGLSVEGSKEEKADNSFSSKTFKKCFFLPHGFNAQEATTGLSNDGVLSIKVPRSIKAAIGF